MCELTHAVFYTCAFLLTQRYLTNADIYTCVS